MANVRILEPMSTGDVIDRAVRLYRRNFTPLVAIVSVPTLIGYIASSTFWFGYSEVFINLESSKAPGISGGAAFLMILGGLGYPVWFFTLLATVAGLSRVIGDHVMLDELITFRRCLAAIRRRLGDITLMALLSVVIIVVVYVMAVVILFVMIMIVGIIAGITGAAGLPPWAVGVMMTLAVLVALAASIFAMLLIISRVVFLPQIIMIEGQSAGSALGRAIRLGARNWHRVGAIALFTYFVSLSLFAALTLPVLAILYLIGVLSAEFMLSPGWNVVYSAFNQISSLLVLPIWVVSYTLLYFDSRVRKEAYDIELLAREISPGFYWQPVVQPPVFGYEMPASFGGRTYVQTSPLGLAGYRPPPTATSPSPEVLRQRVDRAAITLSPMPPDNGSPATPIARPDVGAADQSVSNQPDPGGLQFMPVHTSTAAPVATCRQCGAALQPRARFCIRCGTAI